MCQICGYPNHIKCGCVQQVMYPCGPYSQYNANCYSGCPIKLDWTCLIYHKDNNEASGLYDGLGLNNGVTLQLALETVSEKIKQLKFSDFVLTFLRESYVINTLQQFSSAVDETLADLQSQITENDEIVADMGFLGNMTADPGDAVDGQYWFRTDLAAANGLKMMLNGSVRTIPTT